MVLGDLEAEVIKVEKPGQGDFFRGIRSLFGQPQFLPGGRNLMFEFANRNKKSISVDLRRSEGQQVLYRLAQHSDALVTNLHPSALREFRVDRETLLGSIASSFMPTRPGLAPSGCLNNLVLEPKAGRDGGVEV
jgi:crotonobetainyl-CoA:carnitine CoA-transferase CaiB-like acyl-CoA transferase